eukprot:TRINITY_DN3749_c0_g2_i1.p1 TRINITY_DN3749_c0_g2~~TRINITY_DN3749_c0_g2_i1.p1  ORF type:complete len:344 (+),score=27.40 TRINITY_DN3749_c0_g2_i1:77-1108(+)
MSITLHLTVEGSMVGAVEVVESTSMKRLRKMVSDKLDMHPRCFKLLYEGEPLPDGLMGKTDIVDDAELEVIVDRAGAAKLKLSHLGFGAGPKKDYSTLRLRRTEDKGSTLLIMMEAYPDHVFLPPNGILSCGVQWCSFPLVEYMLQTHVYDWEKYDGCNLSFCAKTKRLKMAQLLFDYGMPLEKETCFLAAEHREEECFAVFVSTLKADLEWRDKTGGTLLHKVVSLAWMEGVQFLFRRNPDVVSTHVHSKDKGERTPLHCAAKLGNNELCSFLLENGADINSRDNQDLTPLHYVARRGYCSCAELLLEYGALTEVVSSEGRTPLQLAKTNGMKNVLKNHRSF